MPLIRPNSRPNILPPSFLSYEHTRAVDTADTVRVLQRVLLQVSVQTEAGPTIAPDPLQLGQLHPVAGRRALPVALGDAIDRGHTLTGWSVGGAGLGARKQQGMFTQMPVP